MTQKNQTLEGKNRILGGDGGRSKIVKNCRTSFMDDPLRTIQVLRPHVLGFFGPPTHIRQHKY